MFAGIGYRIGTSEKGGITYYVYIVLEPVIAVQNKTIQRTDSESSEDYYEGFSYF